MNAMHPCATRFSVPQCSPERGRRPRFGELSAASGHRAGSPEPTDEDVNATSHPRHMGHSALRQPLGAEAAGIGHRAARRTDTGSPVSARSIRRLSAARITSASRKPQAASRKRRKYHRYSPIGYCRSCSVALARPAAHPLQLDHDVPGGTLAFRAFDVDDDVFHRSCDAAAFH